MLPDLLEWHALDSGCDVNSHLFDWPRVYFLLFRFHNVGQFSKARFIQTEIGRDDGRQRHIHDLKTRVSLARYVDGLEHCILANGICTQRRMSCGIEIFLQAIQFHFYVIRPTDRH